MKENFLSEQHRERFVLMLEEMGFDDNIDLYWKSLLFIISGNETLCMNRKQLINYDERSINSEKWFDGVFSGGEQRLLGLTYNLFTSLAFYEHEDGRRYYISPLDVFSGLDPENYELAKNALDIRFH
ncbi:DUF6075 family protein [Enterococcus mundtii]|uniref:DUF6075 family protein n=1 Tax=Enterococcus mundtii TaxID=53346 RepID=UPI001A969249|nr:DUF6075 family protein [Enterococcus mundtii]MBO1087225.1 hypothetical protein [Enterococcus mundtii]